MKTKGFTLIELLMVMVIAGILIGIAYPSYREYINRARRADGQAALLDLASRMERYYSEENTYLNASIGTGGTTDVLSSSISAEGWYSIGIAQATASSFSLTAIPRNAQGTYDTRCQTLTLNSQGQKGIAAGPSGSPSGTAADCW